MLFVGIIGFIIGEFISRAFRKDASKNGDDLPITWIFKIGIALVLMMLVYNGCK
jgi:hypothetical protein